VFSAPGLKCATSVSVPLAFPSAQRGQEMLHSSFDLETYAKTYQDNVLRGAKQAQRVAEAQNRGQISRGGMSAAWTRLVAAVRNRFAAAGASALSCPTPESIPDVAMIHMESSSVQRMRPVRGTEPYSGMVVIARASNVPIAERPHAVRDC
jgi:hypothetical protein